MSPSQSQARTVDLDRVESAKSPSGRTYENISLSVTAALTGVCVLLALAVGLDTLPLFRPLLALAFVSFVPGAAIVRWFRPLTTVTTYGLVIPLSLAFTAGFASVALWADFYHPFAMLVMVSTASLTSLWVGRRDLEVDTKARLARTKRSPH